MILNKKDALIYLAAPYTHDDPRVVAERMRIIDSYAASMIGAGYRVFSPLSYGHNLARRYSLATNYEYWASFNDEILRACQYLLVLRLPGWQDSKGLAREIAIAKEREIPIEYLYPDLSDFGVTIEPDTSGLSINQFEVLGAN
ncbi:MAG: DUF1937 family protein [Cyanobacteria bacterium P01_H01_bin.15]